MHQTFLRTIERLMRPFGLDVFIERDDSGQGLFAFERRGEEMWGLGLHFIVSPIAPPQAA